MGFTQLKNGKSTNFKAYNFCIGLVNYYPLKHYVPQGITGMNDDWYTDS